MLSFSRVFALVSASLSLAACCSGGNVSSSNPDPTKLADILESKLKDNCVGYAFTVSVKEDIATFRAGGEARRFQDSPKRFMSAFDKLNVASVSKTVTAAALLQILKNYSQVSLNTPFYTYLPSHWSVHDSLKSVTFKQLLTHQSGFMFNNDSFYSSMKSNMQTGINPAGIGQPFYHNVNYGVLRLIIPKLAGYSITTVPQNIAANLLAAAEAQQDQELADAYIDYVQKKIFDKLGGALPGMACKPTDENPALCYQFPLTNSPGTHFGDMTLSCGSRGWHMSALQLGVFFRSLHYTDKILSQDLSEKMKAELLGYDKSSTTGKGVSYHWKNGNYPGSINPGELNSWIIGFGNDIQIALIINSQFKGAKSIEGTLVGAFDEWYP